MNLDQVVSSFDGSIRKGIPTLSLLWEAEASWRLERCHGVRACVAWRFKALFRWGRQSCTGRGNSSGTERGNSNTNEATRALDEGEDEEVVGR